MSSPAVFPFFATLQALATEHGLDVRISGERLAGHGAHVVVKRRHAEVSVSYVLLGEPLAVQEFAAAHEIAHVVLRHGFWRRGLPAAAWAVAVTVVEVAGLWLALHHLDHTVGPVLVLLLGALGPLFSAMGAWAVLARRTRTCEMEADRLALAWGYTLAGSQDAHVHGENRLTTSRFYRPFRMHPLPNHRAAAGGASQGSAAKENDHDRTDSP